MENALLISEIRRIYDDYLAETHRLELSRKPTDGLLGFGRGPDSNPCHDRFSERLEQALESPAANASSSREASEILRYIYGAPLACKDNALAYWMLLAVHALTEKLIGNLSPDDAASLFAWYHEAFPKHTRLPAQKKIAGLLASAGIVGKDKKRALLDKFGKRSV